MIKRRVLILVVLLAVMAAPAGAKHLHPEKWYQDQWCEDKGETEVVMVDGTRVDCLTETMAVEVDFARGKWYEGITQALHYGLLTGKEPVLLLIIEAPEDIKYYYRAERLINHYNLPVEIILTGAGL